MGGETITKSGDVNPESGEVFAVAFAEMPVFWFLLFFTMNFMRGLASKIQN